MTEPERAREPPGTSPTLENFASQVERLHHATFGQGARIVGLTAPYPASGVSLVAELLAERCALGGAPTLLCDLSQRKADPSVYAHWEPGDGSAGQFARADRLGFDRLTPQPDQTNRFRFNDGAKLRVMFEHDLSRYTNIVVDLAALDAPRWGGIDAAVASTSCDSIMLVCHIGSLTRPALTAFADTLRKAGAPLVGIIANDQSSPTLGQEVAREARRFRRFAPGLLDYVARKAETSIWLAVPA